MNIIQVKKRNSDSEISRERSIAGWSKWPTRQAHDLKTAGSNPWHNVVSRPYVAVRLTLASPYRRVVGSIVAELSA